MKKISTKNLFKIIPVLLTFVFGIFLFNINSGIAEAEQLSEIPEYFSVYTATYNSEQTGAQAYTKNSTDTFANNDAIFLKSNEAVVLEFDKQKLLMADSSQYKINQEVGYTITINGNTFSTTPNESNGMVRITQDEIFKLVINPSLTTPDNFNYGNYSILFTYWFLNDVYSDPIPLSFTCNFYVFDYDDYCSVSAHRFSKAQEYGSYYYNYTGTTDGNLFSLTYDYTKFNVFISKVYGQLSYTTQLVCTNGNLNITNLNETSTAVAKEYVKVDKILGTTNARVVFNDLGTYYISYQTINPYYNYEVFNNYFNLSTMPNKGDNVYVYGYQAFYTSNNGIQEFKQLNDQNSSIVNQQADVTNLVVPNSTDSVAFDALKTAEANNSLTVVKTNQSPIRFNTNCQIVTSDSAYYYFKDLSTQTSLPTNTYQTNQTAYKFTDYSGTPISGAGYYFVKLAYIYDNYSSSTQYQYFLFELTNDSPKLSIVDEGTNQEVANHHITRNNIVIGKAQGGAFDSTSVLKVYKSTTFENGALNNEANAQVITEQTTLTESAKYKVVLSYGSSSQKSYVSYFTIDKTGIQNITISVAEKYSGSLYKKGQTVNGLFTNTPVAISWDDKGAVGKAQTYAQYKYFPTSYSASYASTLTSDQLQSIYQSPYTKNCVPSTHTFSYSGGTLPVSNYINTANLNTFSEGNILNGGGLYIIKIYDETALVEEVNGENVKYLVVFVDTSKTNIITASAGKWSLASDSKVTSSDYSLYFGAYKLIQFEGLNTLVGDSSWDEWLKTKVVNNQSYSSNFITSKNKMFLRIGVNNTVYYTQNSNGNTSAVAYALNTSNNYSITQKAMNGSTPNESQYDFYVVTNANQNAQNNLQSYIQNFDANHRVTFSTDNSKMKLYYTKADGTTTDLSLIQVRASQDNTIKYTNYNPTSKTTLSASKEILNFSYCTNPTTTLAVDSIKMDYYAFEKGAKNTYVFKQSPTSTIYIYQKDGTPLGTKTSEAYTYTWQLNVESYSITASDVSTRTKAGKYVITRTYQSSSDQNDPVTRVLEFIVDRNGIISAPEIDSNANSIYYTGGEIKLQVLNNYQSITANTLFFHDIYFASQMSQNSDIANPVLTTNLLPVTLYVPAFKYGYSEQGASSKTFNYSQIGYDNENSIVEYYDAVTGTYVPYSAYKLSAVVEYRTTRALNTPAEETYVFNTQMPSNNYLTTQSASDIITFNKQGVYHVTISTPAGDSFVFDFEIVYAEPEYTLLDANNNPLKQVDGTYYINKNKIRISWKDSTSEFLSNINKNAITYTLSNGITGKINPSSIQTNEDDNSYYADLDLSTINGAYRDGSNVYITLQFNGERDDYQNLQYFSKTSKVVVDLQAPISNVSALVAQTGLTFSTLRQYTSPDVYGNKYNTSKTDGVFAYYSYVVDVANFKNLLKTPKATDYDFSKAYYRVFETNDLAKENTKYVIGNTQESEIHLENYGDTYSDRTLFERNLTYETLFEQYVGKYVEIIEEDYAGNRTVFTIYITDVANSSQTSIEYNALTTSTDDTLSIAFKDLSPELKLRSKYSLSLKSVDMLANESLNDKYFMLISVNGVKYVKTPYSASKFYKVTEYQNASSPLYNLSDITNLTSSSSAQSIIIYNAPIHGQITLLAYVLNRALNYSILAQFEDNQQVEGIVIQIPATSADSNTIYATKLTVTGVVGENVINPIVIDNENFFKQEQAIPASQLYKMSYVKGPNGEMYLRFQITRSINKNDYFVYTFVDNFGEEYVVPHIFGQIEITNPITSNGNIITSYSANGTYVYYSTENITYKYDTTIYSGEAVVTLAVGTSKSYTYYVSRNGARAKVEELVNGTKIEDLSKEYEKYFTCDVLSGVVMSITMKSASIDCAKSILGDSVAFSVKLTLNEDFGKGEDEKFFNLYNKIPKFSLLSENGEDVTGILGNRRVSTNNVKVNYELLKLDFPYELYIIDPNGVVSNLNQEFKTQENGTYSIVVNYLGDLKGLSKTLNFTIKNVSDYKFSVMKVNADGSFTEVFATGKEYSYSKTVGSVTTYYTEQNHYIVNGNYTILLNENLNLVYNDSDVEVIDEYTTIYTIHTDYSSTSVVQYYSCRIAVTKIPQTYTLFKENNFVEYDSVGNSKDLSKLTSVISSILTKDGYEAGRKIAWSKYYLIPENTISATIYYGEVGKTVFTPVLSETKDYYTITLKTSGVYYFKFTDIAGNTHFFGAYSDTEYFAIKYLSSVIFQINEQSPINYAIYDSQVKVTIPESTLSYYDANAKPTLNVELNGQQYKVDNNNKYEWSFKQAGLYKIWFSAKIDEKSIYEAPLFFTILSPNESRTVFSYNAYQNCFIEDILLNGTSVNSKLANLNNGKLYQNKYLTELTLHKNDIKTGNGIWTIVVNTNNEFGQKFSFTVWINDPVVPITLSHESGTSTTDDITITFLVTNMLNQAGECIVKITGEDDIVITQEALDNGDLADLNEIVLTKSREYFIEVTTLSGQLLYSSYINKTEPLNTVSIIIIVVVSIVVIASTVIFILMRKRMKIK